MKTRLSAILFALSLAAACHKNEAKGPVVAKVGDDVITADELKHRLDETSPFLRARYNTLDRKKEFLENLIRNELLAQEAQRQGYDKSPAVKEQMKQAIIQELSEHQADVELVKLQVKTVALNRSFDESKDSIRGRMARERRSHEYDDWMKKLRQNTTVAINDAELEKVVVEGAPQGQPGMMPPVGLNPMQGHQPNAAPPVPLHPAGTPPTAASKIGGN